MKKFKPLAFLLILCMLLSVVSCAGNDESSIDSSAPANEFMNTDGKYVGNTSGKTYEGKTVTFLTCSVNTTYESEILFNTYEDGETKTLPEKINDNLKKRMDYVEEVLKLTVEEMKVHDTGRPGGGMCTAIRNGNLSGTTDYQIVVPCLYDAATLALEDQLYNLLGEEFSALQLDAPWWNQAFNDSMTYAGQLYFTIGDIGIGNKSSTAALYFNLDLWNKHELSKEFGGNPYELVRSGKWTVDTVFEAALQITKDENSDGKIDYKDTAGWGGQLDDMWSIFFASGERIAKANADGYPMISIYSERSATLMNKLQEFVQDDEHYLSANDYFGVDGITWPTEAFIEPAFKEGRLLFYNANVGAAINLGDMEQHYGVVPVPKADETQESYYSLINPWTSTCFAIPLCVRGSELEMTIDLLNVMAAESMNTVTVYYHEVLNYMKTRDDESVEMLNNYILPTRGCDIGMVYKWGKLDSLLQEMASAQPGTFRSKYDAKATAAENDMQQALEFFKSKE